MKLLFKTFICLTLFMSCTSDDSTSEVLPPSNLVLSIDDAAIDDGIVEVTVTADKANYYEINFGDDSNFIRNNGEKLSHTYTNSGEYIITARAYTIAGVFIEKTGAVNISIDTTIEIPEDGYTTPDSYDGYELVWQDEFDGTTLSSDWIFEIGNNNGWGNNELEYYRQENTTVGDGYLTIEARKEAFGEYDYTSSRIKTEGKKFFKYGRIDIRAVLPNGQGIWPALWMLGESIGSIGWPKCGEIDIMELVGGSGKDNTVHSTMHWDNDNSYASYGDSYTLGSGIFTDEFHVFTLIWDEEKMVSYVDDVQYFVIDITPDGLSEFHENFFFIFNVAVGGNWPGSPNESTQFPQRMVVDYVRVFQVQ